MKYPARDLPKSVGWHYAFIAPTKWAIEIQIGKKKVLKYTINLKPILNILF